MYHSCRCAIGIVTQWCDLPPCDMIFLMLHFYWVMWLSAAGCDCSHCSPALEVCPLQFNLQRDIRTSTESSDHIMFASSKFAFRNESRSPWLVHCTSMRPIDYPDSSVAIMFCIPKSCRQCFWIMLLAQCAQCFGHILPLFRISWKKCAHWVLHSKLVCGFFLSHAFGAYHESGVLIGFCISTVYADCLQIMLSAHCAHGFGHIVLYFAAHHETSVPIEFCIPNLFADCFSILLLAHCAHGFGHIVLLCCPSWK